jgi:late competence protein required for DNA uptake (superfamily II DNA/RNA helicase)
MKKKIAMWLAGIIREELDKALDETTAEINRELAAAFGQLKAHTTNVTAGIVHEIRKNVRRACAFCGQMTWKYETDEKSGKFRCTDCVTKGRH